MELNFDDLEVFSSQGLVEFIDKDGEIFSLKTDKHFSKTLLTSDAFKTLFCLIYNSGYNDGVVCGKSVLKSQIELVLDKCDR